METGPIFIAQDNIVSLSEGGAMIYSLQNTEEGFFVYISKGRCGSKPISALCTVKDAPVHSLHMHKVYICMQHDDSFSASLPLGASTKYQVLVRPNLKVQNTNIY